jgi:glycerol-3-phosphate dehydrogenase (NAD(P)+)
LEDILGEMTMVSEGVKSCRGLLELAASKQVQMPIAEEVGHVLHDGKSARQAVVDLMARPPRVEAETYGLVEAGVDIVYSS